MSFEEAYRSAGLAERNGQAPGRLLSEVEPEKLEWLWEGRIPLGKLTVVDGDPGNGKSALTTDLAARVSVGREWPDGAPCEAGGAVICSAEDGEADTIRPRLDAASGDPSRVLALATVPDGDSERMLSIPEDLEIIRRGVERVEARLLVVDPIMAFFSGKVDSHKDQGVRRALAPLAKLAEETRMAVLVVRHLNQSQGGNPLYRGQGSIGIVGAARAGLVVAPDPEDEDRRVLAPQKANLSAKGSSLLFELRGAENGAVKVEYVGETHHTANGLLSAPTDPEERSALDEATDFLRDALGNGPMWSKTVKKDARDADITDATLRRAKTALGVRSAKEADGSWTWALPEGEHLPQASQDEHLEHIEHLPIGKGNMAQHDDEQGAQGLGEEHLRESRLPMGHSIPTEGQGAQGVHAGGDENANGSGVVTCIHNFPSGKGCYVCDPEHPYRKGRT